MKKERNAIESERKSERESGSERNIRRTRAREREREGEGERERDLTLGARAAEETLLDIEHPRQLGLGRSQPPLCRVQSLTKALHLALVTLLLFPLFIFIFLHVHFFCFF